jgi:hypothetical protein
MRALQLTLVALAALSASSGSRAEYDSRPPGDGAIQQSTRPAARPRASEEVGARGWSPSPLPPAAADREPETGRQDELPTRGRPPGTLGETGSGGSNARDAGAPERNAWPSPAQRQAMPRDAGRDGASRRGPAAIDEPLSERAREVERGELAPIMGADGSRLPHDLWRGLDVAGVEAKLAGLSMPPRSAALHDLWRRLIIARVPEPSGGKTANHFLSLRLEALYRSGLLEDLERFAAGSDGAQGDPVLEVQRAKALLGLGQGEKACAQAKGARYQGEVPRQLALEAMLIIAYCAALQGNPSAASLTIDLAREQGLQAPFAFAVIDHLAAGGTGKPRLPPPKDMTLIDYRLLELAKLNTGRIIDKAEPALVAALAREQAADPATRIEAAEDAARILAIDAKALAEAYRTAAAPPADVAARPSPKTSAAMKRAGLAQAIAQEKSPATKARQMRALLQEARTAFLYVPVARMLLADLESLPQAPDLASFAETAVEIALAGGDYHRAVSWALFGSSATGGAAGEDLLHWMTLIDIAGAKAQVPRGSGLRLTEELALRGKLAPEMLHRLVTVLDSLDYDIPIPLWDVASRTPQPAKGHLPATGVLAELKSAAAERKYALTVLLAIRSLGPDGAEGAHMIALGDSIRALKTVGLEEDARRLGFEALFAAWPRQAVR